MSFQGARSANPESIITGLGLWIPALGHAALASEASAQRGNIMIMVRAPDTRPELGSSVRGSPRPGMTESIHASFAAVRRSRSSK
jgi:hypothetical protein